MTIFMSVFANGNNAKYFRFIICVALNVFSNKKHLFQENKLG